MRMPNGHVSGGYIYHPPSVNHTLTASGNNAGAGRDTRPPPASNSPG